MVPAAVRSSTPASARMLHWSGISLTAASWISAAAFGLYILAFYIGAIPAGRFEQWNENLPGLYHSANVPALWAISAHFASGAIILLLGPVQLIAEVRRRWIGLHRWIGRIYVFTAAIAGIGGLGFILTKGTIGGGPMNAGFGLYGALMVLAAVETYQHARARRLDRHSAWAIRLFALAIGSWLYRMDYGFWLLAAHGIGHTHGFRGPFDIVMAFFFYVPNLALAELYLRSRGVAWRAFWQVSAAVVLDIAALFVAVGTYYFFRYYWGPGIVASLTGRNG